MLKQNIHTLCAMFMLVGLTCEKSAPRSAIGVALEVVGSVRAGDRVLRSGSEFMVEEAIHTGPESSCLLRIPHGRGEILVRIRPESIVIPGDSLIELRVGSALFALLRKGAPANLSVQTPTATASVRGTRFKLEVSPGGSLLQVEHGEMAYRPFVARLEALPASLLDHPVLAKSVSLLTESERRVAAAFKLNYSPPHSEVVLAAVPALDQVLGRVESILQKDPRAIEETHKIIEDAIPANSAPSIYAELKAQLALLPTAIPMTWQEQAILRAEMNDFRASLIQSRPEFEDSQEWTQGPPPVLYVPQPRSEYVDTVLLKDGSSIGGVKAKMTGNGVLAVNEDGTEKFYPFDVVDQVLPGR